MIIFAGGMSRAGEVLLTKVRTSILARAWTCLPQTTPLVVASSEHAGPVGAALFAAKLSRMDIVQCPEKKPSQKSGVLNGMVSATAGILTVAFWAAKSKTTRCPALGGVANVLPSVALYAGFLYFLYRR